MTILSQPYFRTEEAALSKLESLVWPQGPVCVHCGAADRIGAVTGKGARPGLKFCCRCRKQFRATMGTIFEGSHVPVHKWFQACFLLTASEVGISPHRLHLKLQITNKTALCLVRRLAESAGAPRRGERLEAPAGFARTRWQRRAVPSAGGRPVAPDGGAGAAGSFWVPPPGATRQFVAFVEAARELDCSADESRFETVLAALARSGLRARPLFAPVSAPSFIAAEEALAEARGRFAVAAR